MTLPCGVVLQWLFTKACKGCKWFFLKDGTNVMFLDKIDLPYCLFVFFVVCRRLRPFGEVCVWKRRFRRVSAILAFRLHPIQAYVVCYGLLPL